MMTINPGLWVACAFITTGILLQVSNKILPRRLAFDANYVSAYLIGLGLVLGFVIGMLIEKEC